MARADGPVMVGLPRRRGSPRGRRGGRGSRPGVEALESRLLLSQAGRSSGFDLAVDPPTALIAPLVRTGPEDAGSGSVLVVEGRSGGEGDGTPRPAPSGGRGDVPSDPPDGGPGGPVRGLATSESQAVVGAPGVTSPSSWAQAAAVSGWVVEILDPREVESEPADATLLLETGEPNSWPGAAQPLPLGSALKVSGTLGQGDSMDLYRLPLPPGFRAFRVSLHVADTPGASAERLVLLDEAGTIIQDGALDPATNRFVLRVRADDGGAGRTVFVGIYHRVTPDWAPPWLSADFDPDGKCPTEWDWGAEESPPSPSPGPSLPSSEYVLSIVTDLDVTGPTPAAPTPPAGPAPEPDATPVDLPGPTPPEPRPSGTFMPAPASPTASPGVVAVVEVGVRPERPGPLRSTAAPAGRLGPGVATRPVDRRSAAVVDMALVDLPPRHDADGPATESSVPHDVDADDALPSHLPDYALPPPVASLPRPPATERLASLAALLASRNRPLRARPADSRPRADTPGATGHAPSRMSGHAAALAATRAGFALAYAVVFTVLLPDLASAFHGGPGRSRPRLRRRLLRRLFGRRGPG